MLTWSHSRQHEFMISWLLIKVRELFHSFFTTLWSCTVSSDDDWSDCRCWNDELKVSWRRWDTRWWLQGVEGVELEQKKKFSHAAAQQQVIKRREKTMTRSGTHIYIYEHELRISLFHAPRTSSRQYNGIDNSLLLPRRISLDSCTRRIALECRQIVHIVICHKLVYCMMLDEN